MYWRRRAIFVGAVIVIVVVLIMIVKAMAGGAPENKRAAVATTPPVTATATKVVEVPNCVGAALEITLEPTESSYADEDRPSFDATVANKGAERCVVDPADIVLNVVSGSDQVFNSGDCPLDAGDEGDEGDEDAELDPVGTLTTGAAGGETAGVAGYAPGNLVLLEPGAQQIIPLSWNALRSDPAECDGELPEPGRPGTYRATAGLDGAESEDAIFELK